MFFSREGNRFNDKIFIYLFIHLFDIIIKIVAAA